MAGNDSPGLTGPDIAVHFSTLSRSLLKNQVFSEVHVVLSALIDRIEILGVHVEAGLLLLSMYK